MTHADVMEVLGRMGEAGLGEVYEGGYGGRGMFGVRCYGFMTGKANRVIEAAATLGLTGAAVDSLGTESIVYWVDLIYTP